MIIITRSRASTDHVQCDCMRVTTDNYHTAIMLVITRKSFYYTHAHTFIYDNTSIKYYIVITIIVYTSRLACRVRFSSLNIHRYDGARIL